MTLEALRPARRCPGEPVVRLRVGVLGAAGQETVRIRRLLAETNGFGPVEVVAAPVDLAALDALLVVVPAPSDEARIRLAWTLRRRPEDVPVVVAAAGERHAFALETLRMGAQDCVDLDRITPRGLGRVLHHAVERQRWLAELDRRGRDDRFLATHDPLTRLPNRQLFLERLCQALAQAQRYAETVGVAFVDLDGFKRVNDTLGHVAGDRVLERIARRLAAAVRDSDTVARFGGDEFTCVLPRLGADGTSRRVIAEKIQQAIGQPIDVGGRRLLLGASIGFAAFPRDAADPEGLLDCADRAMYEAKRHRRGPSPSFVTVNAVAAEEARVGASSG